ncbi:Transcriptional regulator, TetR-like protein [Alloalcanivorax dieselolei B5]|uniref:Transcriptional regulator, TetR-like protein n=1 Tax=Alcanivorax dieselolei (strain DSM 16502 / CGMCC 1.3690 / MCCC 1A00001 / B-5) TaxID=930169 RepID=K0CGC4_ALCDB|nr:TetR/AcrR family transcriptional regulator [Alloalcanivorax dieselolei]AFT70732.1 Transcriptional regulator, TetR-like protein [Alloalcanivorax dieselolei B5]GGJ97381.1 TetR family transcriptional regulator [Alloalcanivorax dieselolei]
MRPERIPQLPPKERILDAAEELFLTEGISRVTVDAIAAKAKSTKMTLYRHFDSKDALVLEWLRLLVDKYSEVFEELSAQYTGDPKAQILGLAKFIAHDLSTASYRGCPFTNSLAEIPEPDNPARRLIEEHKKRQFLRLATLCTEAGLPEPKEAAMELTYLMEGAQVVSQNKSIAGVGENLIRMIREKLTAITANTV